MEAEEAVKEAVLALQKADQLTRELKSVFGTGNRFVCGNHAWKLEHRAIGFIPGNRDWLVPDRDVTVIAG